MKASSSKMGPLHHIRHVPLGPESHPFMAATTRRWYWCTKCLKSNRKKRNDHVPGHRVKELQFSSVVW